ncbi:MAG: AMP-binding protein [Sedimentitalea sp.]|uniref:AMP-binding protein n=1 Tax=Sedimentitalea sp. TaxID=2048915 RepID=UPI003267A335
MNTAELDRTAPEGGRSHVIGALLPALKDVTIPQLFRETLAEHGDREALVFSEAGIRLTYREFDQKIDACAAGLLALGVQKGDRVGIWSPNRFEWVLTQFATARMGAILVNINPAYRLSELEHALNKVGCKALIAAPVFKSSDYVEMIRALVPELESGTTGDLNAAKLPDLRHVIVMSADPGPGILSFDALVDLGGPDELGQLDAIDATLTPQDPINIQFTSGTTGLPKGATLSHFNIVNNARYVTDRIDMTDADTLVIPVPLYHCFGMVMGVLGAISKGARIVFPGEAFDPVQTLDAISDERATALYGVPTMFVAMLQELNTHPRDLSCLRTGIMAGAPCPIEVMNRVGSEMNMSEVTICYGMTETSPVSFQSFTNDPVDKRCETVGRVHPHLEVKLIDDAGEIVPVGERGEICTKGYSVMTGYWGDDVATDKSIVGGWMHTGDLGVFDELGFCSIVGRVKDMIIRGGENIFPREIEEFLIRHPNVSEAQVFGVPDEKLGEVVCAWIIERPGSGLVDKDVQEFCKGQIAHYKVPKHIRMVEELPMTITGKPQKFVMSEQMQELLAKEAG